MNNTTADGVYVSVGLSLASQNELRRITKLYNIANPVPRKKLHSTILYSETPFEIEFRTGNTVVDLAYEEIWLEKWIDHQGKHIVVARFNSPDMTRRHKYYISLGGKHGFPTYDPHVTLSYDAGDAEIPEGMISLKTPLVGHSIIVEPLNTEWE